MSAAKASNWRGAEEYAITLCRRMKQARLMNGMTLEVASEKFGYGGNKTQISLFETYGDTAGRTGRPPPFWVVIAASACYAVPIDYLFGLIGDIEVTRFDQERHALSRKVEVSLGVIANRIGAQIARVAAEGTPTVAMCRQMIERAEEWDDVFERFRTKNKDAFDDLLVGNKLIDTGTSLQATIKQAGAALKRHDNFSLKALQVALGEADGTLSLFGEANDG
ncbi:hypothetical protein [Nevskia ramosa]|uniref:hypothetical protein n=1 Tax=Nevskia ramosa TaxID=64002 RepID=UPI003D0A6C29